MTAKLTATHNLAEEVFKIIPKTNEKQVVNLYHNESIDWIWHVIPTKKGEFELDLTLEVLLYNDLGEHSTSIPVYNDKVNVFIEDGTENIPSEYGHQASRINTENDTNSLASTDALGIETETETGDSNSSGNLVYFGILVLIGIALIALLIYFIKMKNKSQLSFDTIPDLLPENIEKLENLVKANKIKQALELILAKIPKTKNKLRNDVLFHLGRLKKNETDRLQNIISNDEYDRTNSKITLAVIDLISELKSRSKINT